MMSRRKRLIGLTLLGVLVLLATSSTSAQSRSLVWVSWNVDIFDIDTTNNSFRVREAYEIQFDGTFRFGTAVIPDDQLEAISNVVVYQDGRPLRAACGAETPGTYCVERVVEGTSIVYYFNSAITNESEGFTLEYDVVGALRAYEDGDQLWWVAIPSDKFGFPVQSAVITVTLPDEYRPREGTDPVATYGAAGRVRVNGPVVVATATNGVAAHEAFEIRVQYPHDPNARVPDWQAAFDARRDFEDNIKPILDLVLIAMGLLIGIAGPLGVYALWYSRGRDPKVGLVPTYLSEPPSDLPPAVVGTLIDERAETRDVMSTIIDLARRRYLVIQEDRSTGLFGISSSEFSFKRTDKDDADLRVFERDILRRVFKGKMSQQMDDLKDKFYVYMSSLKNDLYGELVEAGLFTASPQVTRSVYTGIGMAILVFAAVTGFIALGISQSFTETLVCVPAAIMASGIAMAAVGSYMPRKTRLGAEEAAKWRAFREYLRNLEKYDDVEGKAEVFDRYLPYAVAFGLDSTWIRRFSKVERVAPPVWYFPTYYGGSYSRGYTPGTPLSEAIPRAREVQPGDIARADGGGGFNVDDMAGGLSSGLESMASGLSNMLESASKVLTSTPSNSSSGSWGSGGSSWSGGGFSGGGGSGGGSRGFG